VEDDVISLLSEFDNDVGTMNMDDDKKKASLADDNAQNFIKENQKMKKWKEMELYHFQN